MYSLISDEKNEEIINIFKNNPEFDINSKNIPTLGGNTILDLVIMKDNFSLAKILVKEGASISEAAGEKLKSDLFKAIDNNNIELLKTIIEIKPQRSYEELESYKDMLTLCRFQGKEEASNLLESYISDNDSWYNYFGSFVPSISISWNMDTQQEDTKVDLSNVVATLLAPNIEAYKEFDQDAEFIANFVGTLSDGDNSKEKMAMIQPMINYFEKIIHEEVFQYQYNKDTSDSCLALPDHSLLFEGRYY